MNPFLRYPLIYGLLSGAVIIGVLIVGFSLADYLKFTHSLWFGYLVQLAAMTFVFVGVKRYRDVELGGVIGFWRALGMALLIVLIATLVYVLVWEVYMAATNYTFLEQFVAREIAHMKASGMAPDVLAKKAAEMQDMVVAYRNPLFRMGFTAIELLVPVGLGTALLSALLLRMPKFLPAR
jgi:hypothetical protein